MIDEISLESPITEKVAWAERVHTAAGSDLSTDPAIKNLLIEFQMAALASREEMDRSGVAHECRDCVLNESGSCCGKGIENRYSGILLLINRLLGRTLPVKRYDPAGCYFLGEKGCLLLARQVICVNYLCRKITDRISPARIAPLRDREGQELNLLFILNERVRAFLKKEPAEPF